MAERKTRKLGQILLDHGWIQSDQLLRAIQAQASVGGRIGTCLLEMDILPEDLLLRALAEQLGVPAASVEDLRGVPPEVYGLVPARIARRCQAIPFRLSGTQLSVALLDVRNLDFQDELAFVTGKRLKAHIANEARIYEGLERYYEVECPGRFMHLLDRLNRARYLWQRGEKAATPSAGTPVFRSPEAAFGSQPWRRATPAPPAPPPPREPDAGADTGPVIAPVIAAASPRPLTTPFRPLSIPVAPEEAARLRPPAAEPPRIAPAPAPPAQPAAAPVAIRPPQARPSAPRPPGAVVAPAAPKPAAPAAAPARSVARPVETPAPAGRAAALAEVEARLLAPVDRDDVARALLAYLAREFGRVALFMVRHDRAIGWMGSGLDEAILRSLSLGLDQPSIFVGLRQGTAFHLGPLAPLPLHRELARAWGGELPAECLALPVRIKDRLVTVVYADRGREGLGGVALAPLQRLAAKAAIAFEMCIMRGKLRQA